MKFFSIFYLILVFGRVSAQETFQLLIENPEWSVTQVPHDIVESENSAIYTVSSVAGGKRDVRLLKTDGFGTVLLDTVYNFTPGDEFAPRIVNAHDGGVLVASTSFSFPIDDQDGYQDILVWKINKTGEILWQKVIAARSFDSMIATSDGNYIILGIFYNETIDLMLTKIDDNGDIIWQNIIERPLYGELISWESPTSLTEIDSALYVGASIGSPLELGSDALLYKIDLNGEIDWELIAPRHFSENTIRVTSVFKFNDHYYFKDRKIDGELYSFNPQTGEFKNINDSIQLNLRDMVVDVDCENSEEITGVISISDQIFNFRKYKVLDSLAYHDVIFDAPLGGAPMIIKSGDGGYIVFSQAADGAMVVSKTDCMGNVAFWSDECNSKIAAGQELLLFPNPVKDKITIEAIFDFSTVTIINALGQTTKYQNSCICNHKVIQVNDLANGVYILLIEGEDKTAIQKFVKTN